MTISFLDPEYPAKLPSRNEVLDFTVADSDPDALVVSLRHSDGRMETIYQDGLVGRFYTVTRDGTENRTFHVRRQGGWPTGRFSLPISEVDPGVTATVRLPWSQTTAGKSLTRTTDTSRNATTRAVLLRGSTAHSAAGVRNVWAADSGSPNFFGRQFKVKADGTVYAQSFYSPNVGGSATISQDIGIPGAGLFFAVAVYTLSGNFETMTCYLNGALVGAVTTATQIDTAIGIGSQLVLADADISNLKFYAASHNRDAMTAPEVAQWWTDIQSAGRFIPARERSATGMDVWLGAAPLTYWSGGLGTASYSTGGDTNGIDTAL